MSYQVLARKYRPKSFETLVGQEHVVRALTHALEHQRLHHAYLFTGTRGVGKTTLSRILAKSFNCVTGVTAKPCGVCEACTAIDAGRFVDYIEMDAASNRGVDEMAQLLEQAIYAPSNARFKVYMIDEVHMLTNHAFNAMLKTLEEPPEHVKFILATTDPQKIPVTVLSRCLQFNLKQMPPGHIVGHLQNILGQEGIAFEQPALRLLAQGAQGSMRDALSLTDQAIAYAAGEVTLEAVQGMLGALDQTYLVRIMDALAAGDGAALMQVADDMASRSLSYGNALQDLGTLLHRLALAQLAPEALPQDVPEREHILRLAQCFTPEDVQLYYQVAVHGRNELGLAPDEYAGFSMTLLRMLAFRPVDGGGSEQTDQAPARRPAAVPSAVKAQVQSASAVKPARSAPAAAEAASAVTAVEPVKSAAMSPARAALAAARGGKAVTPARSAPAAMPAEPAPARASASLVPPWEEGDNPPPIELPDEAIAQKKSEPPSLAEPAFQPAPAAKPAAPAKPYLPQAIPALNWDGNWPQLAAALALRGVVQQLAQQSELLRCEPLGDGYAFTLRIPLETLRSAGSIDKLAAALTDHFGRTIRVDTEIGAVEHTANARLLAEQETRQREAEQTMHSDPFVQTLMREFGATIVPGSIRPV
ncbi:DNA polymerase-3 subunit gamma/tau [Noviherbaspirillum humi]|uniref:DNA polymerase III subunit gamma/tau n=1 Tax=Noviherbaspirillum humi TaxID=1688639 RepID=A0A239DGK4_9BURK|nr:DNA polymerase III subunit gamma/tau [Noviherbaspirillum humi]SNS31585.1 DNA polymerase-3 subunit gamma/tau [Noviherbaspirillum humi]